MVRPRRSPRPLSCSPGTGNTGRVGAGSLPGGITHQQFLRKSVDEASNVLVNLDFEGSPNPVITIDELGWDYDGGIDRHSAPILKAVHEKKRG